MTVQSKTARDHANISETRQDLGRILIECRTREGFDEASFRELLGRERARRFDAYLERSSRQAAQLLEEVSLDARRLDDLAVSIAPLASRQNLGEKMSLSRLQTDLSATFFVDPIRALPRGGRGAFIACPDIAKSLDFAGMVGQTAYVIAQKCSNNSGGSQAMSQSELERMAMAATFPATRYDGFILRSPERVLSRIASAFKCERAVFVLLQDGDGRQSDIEGLQEMCAHANLLDGLFVFADTTENFILMQPLIHAHAMGGVEALSAGQQAVYEDAVVQFRQKFPQGHNGFTF
jgi:hypothetical protein